MKKVLLTGFEPFGGKAFNPSYEAVKKVSAPEGFEVKKLCLPVTWEAPEKLICAIDEFSPDAVIMCGLASGSTYIRIERVGINVCGAVKDNNGVYADKTDAPCECPICIDGDVAYFSSFNFEKILGKLKSAEISAGYSFSAGTYICNLILYSVLKKNSDEKTGRKIGFIHVPDADEFTDSAACSMPLDKIARALEIAIVNCF